MGQEIELKIPLTQEEYDFVFSVIAGNTIIEGLHISKFEKLFKSDEYFSRYETMKERNEKVLAGLEPRVIRIRSEKKENGKEESFFTLKWKTVKNGIEMNREDETAVENADVLRSLFSSIGFYKYFEKNKDAYSVYCKYKDFEEELHLELEKVNQYLYFEVEYTGNSSEPEKIKADLNTFVKLFGLDPQKKDFRSWMSIILGKIE